MSTLLSKTISLLAVALSLRPEAAQASELTPAVLPLAVRNPYFSYWMHNAREVPWDHWPIFWAGQGAGLGIMASVPASNTVYPLFGKSHLDLDDTEGSENYTKAYPHYVGVQYDACATNMTFRIPPPSKKHDPLDLVISWLSPITPTSSMRQSIPASYISIDAQGTFDIDIYLEVNGDFVTGQQSNVIRWSHSDIVFDDSGVELQAWQLQRSEEQIYTEFEDRPEWGKLYLTGPSDARYESGEARSVRQSFARSGTLKNTYDQHFRSVKDREPVFALHKSLNLTSKLRTSTDSVLFTLAHIQDEIVQYQSARGLTYMRPLWKSWFQSDYALLMFHYTDYENAVELAGNYSAQLEHDAIKAAGREYADNVALAARQVLGATAFSGTPDNPLLFLKEISSNGNTQTVDVIFPSWPFFMYTNPRWGAYLLEPLLEHQGSGQYPNRYSMHDLGAHYPNMTGHSDGNDEYMPLEECGDMLIMGMSLVNALRYGDDEEPQSIWAAAGRETDIETDSEKSPFPLRIQTSEVGIPGVDNKFGGGAKGEKQAKAWLSKYWKLWDQWTGFLVDESLYPRNQLSTDDFAGWLKLHSNLALKGMVGINAFAQLAGLMGEDHKAKNHSNIAADYISKWQDLGLSRDKTRAKLSYNWYGSWTTVYSLYSDALLCFHSSSSSSSSSDSTLLDSPDGQKPLHPPTKTPSSNFIPHEIYQNQSRWYALSMQKYGLPLDSRHLYTKSDWEFQVAAVAAPAVQKEIVHRVATWINESEIFFPMTDLYDSEEGGLGAGNRFIARPVVGSHFSLLALGRACGGKAVKGLVWDEDDSEDGMAVREDL